MPLSRRLLALIPAPFFRRTTEHLAVSSTALLGRVALVALVALVTSTAEAQVSAASDTPLHVAASRFEFIVSGDTQPPAKPLRVHNGGKTRLTEVRLTRLAYADSA